LHNRETGLREGLVDYKNVRNDENVAVGDKKAGFLRRSPSTTSPVFGAQVMQPANRLLPP
jgi:hypothetical protein